MKKNVMEFNCYNIKYDSISYLKNVIAKESVVIKDDGTNYIGLYKGHHLIGFVGWKLIGKKIRYKSDYVIPSWRGQGMYSRLWEERDKQVLKYAKENGIKEITAMCTDMSYKMYLKNKFEIVNKNKNNKYFLKREI